MSAIKTMYLFLYNVIQWFGWILILTDRIANHDVPELSGTGVVCLYIFQSLAVMEILHSLVGLVRANPMTTIVQVASRLQLLLVYYYVEEARESSGLLPMIVAWGLVEIVRYLYLALNMFGISPRWLTWLRYSLFYVLYPLGVYGEMKVLFDSLPTLQSKNILSFSLPNEYNFEFSFAAYIWILLYVVYLPGLYVQYTHMMHQRKKAFSQPSRNK